MATKADDSCEAQPRSVDESRRCSQTTLYFDALSQEDFLKLDESTKSESDDFRYEKPPQVNRLSIMIEMIIFMIDESVHTCGL